MDRTRISAILHSILAPRTDSSVRRFLQASASEQTHPVFAQNRWINLSDEQYALISPALVLASRLLQSTEVTHFLASYIYAPRIGTDGKERFLLTNSSVTGAATFTQQMSDVRRLLVILSNHIVLRFTTRTAAAGAEGATRGRGQPIREGEPGHGSGIELNKRFLRALDPTLSVERLTNWFFLAVTLVHEAMHAFHKFHNGRAKEPFFGGESFNELGTQLEVLLFGGQLDTVRFDKNLPLERVMTEQGVLHIRTPHLADVEATGGKAYLVKEAWLRSLFTNEFWSRELPASGAFVPDTVFLSNWQRDLATQIWSWAN